MSFDSQFDALLEEAVLRLDADRRTGVRFLSTDLNSLRKEVTTCERCELCDTRNKTVFGEGSPNAHLLLIGEAPGFQEDKQGQPFVGPAGELLTKMIQAIELTREGVFIANVLKCRPPGNQDPLPHQIESCRPFLQEQIRLIRPRVICTLGAFAARTVIGTDQSLSRLRGRIHLVEKTPLIATFHPAYLLRRPEDKFKAWEDLKTVKRELEKQPGVAGFGRPSP